MDNKKTIVVLGVPRSGTSIVAGILSILGVNMRGNQTPDFVVPRGSFEDTDFNKLSGQILKTAGGGYWQPPSHQEILKQEKNFNRLIQQLIRKKSDSSIWGWKDPATSSVIELFLPHLTNPHFIITKRNIDDIIKSNIEFFRVKHAKKYPDFRKILNYHLKEIQGFLNKHPNIPKLFVQFEDIIKNPIQESYKLADFLDIDLTKRERNQIKKFIIPRNKIKAEKRKAQFRKLIFKIKTFKKMPKNLCKIKISK